LSFSYPERRPTFFSLVLPGAQVKHFNDALNELVQSQEEFLLQWRDSQHRRGTPRNSSDVQSSRSFSPSQFPWPAQHFNTQEAVPSVSDQAIADVRGLLSRQDAAFPITFLPSTHMLVVDTGASIIITPSKADFVGDIKPVQPTVLKGIAAGLQVAGIGTASYTFMVPNGETIFISLPNTLYVPACSVRLLCPRHVAASTSVAGDDFTSQKDCATL
jgi:hypothetical protein